MLVILALVVLCTITQSQILDTIHQKEDLQRGRNSCEAYYDGPEQICPIGEHCVGSCRFRYCGSTLITPLDQSKCVESTHESCGPHYNYNISRHHREPGALFYLYKESILCPDGEYCSGHCNYRFCSSTEPRLDQIKCDLQINFGTNGICEAYTDAWGVKRNRGECPYKYKCSGTCSNRYCSLFFKYQMLDQFACSRSTQSHEEYETCEGYFNTLGLYQPRQRCTQHYVCSGSCEKRACRGGRLDQTTCGEEH